MCCNFGWSGWYPERMVKEASRPAMFKWRQTAPEVILCAVRWYLRYSLSLRDVEKGDSDCERGFQPGARGFHVVAGKPPHPPGQR